jgi:hypothetical protein
MESRDVESRPIAIESSAGVYILARGKVFPVPRKGIVSDSADFIGPASESVNSCD